MERLVYRLYLVLPCHLMKQNKIKCIGQNDYSINVLFHRKYYNLNNTILFWIVVKSTLIGITPMKNKDVWSKR